MNDVTKIQVQAIIELIGARIRDAREAKGWNQAGAAQSAGKMQPSKYGAIERGERKYQVDALVQVLTGLDIDPLDLFKPRKFPKKIDQDPCVLRTVEQLKDVLEYGGKLAELATLQVDQWHKSIPPKKNGGF